MSEANRARSKQAQPCFAEVSDFPAGALLDTEFEVVGNRRKS